MQATYRDVWTLGVADAYASACPWAIIRQPLGSEVTNAIDCDLLEECVQLFQRQDIQSNSEELIAWRLRAVQRFCELYQSIQSLKQQLVGNRDQRMARLRHIHVHRCGTLPPSALPVVAATAPAPTLPTEASNSPQQPTVRASRLVSQRRDSSFDAELGALEVFGRAHLGTAPTRAPSRNTHAHTDQMRGR